MTNCAQCGHDLGVGRYCTNCGHRIDDSADAPIDQVVDETAELGGLGGLAAAPDQDPWRTNTAERPRVPAPQPSSAPPTPLASAPAWTPPSAPRFPLFADEVAGDDGPDLPVTGQTSHRRSRPWGPWVAGAAVLAVLVLLGTWLLGGDDDGEAREPRSSTTGTPATGEEPTEEAPTEQPPVGLTAQSQVTVPATAGPGQDTEGNPVVFDGANMLDGAPESAWRMPGDATGQEVVITLPTETRLRSVGLINGYAKQAPDRDWYHGNRRIEQVEWVFDDGTVVGQTLGDTTAVQSVDVDVTTTTLTLRLVRVSQPGSGPSRRDFTAISDLLLVER